FEALKRRGARVMLVADRPPAALEGIDDRLRSRFEGGLVLELDGGTPGGDLILEDERVSLDASLMVPGFSLDPRSRSAEADAFATGTDAAPGAGEPAGVGAKGPSADRASSPGDGSGSGPAAAGARAGTASGRATGPEIAPVPRQRSRAPRTWSSTGRAWTSS